MKLFPSLESTTIALKNNTITAERKEILQLLIGAIQEKVDNNKEIRLNFICTHNSRRSHLSQIWAQALAHYFSIKNVYCYSGGAEATSVYPMVISTLKNQGFKIEKLAEIAIPIYAIKYSDNEHPIIAFSKTMDAFFNPKNNFIAIMTCSQADEACPFVPGAKKRIPLTYEDPKLYDNSSLQEQKYQERSLEIASELFYVFSQIKNN